MLVMEENLTHIAGYHLSEAYKGQTIQPALNNLIYSGTFCGIMIIMSNCIKNLVPMKQNKQKSPRGKSGPDPGLLSCPDCNNNNNKGLITRMWN